MGSRRMRQLDFPRFRGSFRGCRLACHAVGPFVSRRVQSPLRPSRKGGPRCGGGYERASATLEPAWHAAGLLLLQRKAQAIVLPRTNTAKPKNARPSSSKRAFWFFFFRSPQGGGAGFAFCWA